jgi:nucleotide-binding universal stress UspA family protein
MARDLQFVPASGRSAKGAGDMMKILIGYDGSPRSNATLADLRKAGFPPKADARVLIACPPLLPLEALAPNGLVPDGYVRAYAQAVENQEATRKHALSQAKDAVRILKASFPGWRLEAMAVPESPAHAILEMAEKWKADQIVIGCRGWNEFGKLIFGSVADKVMNHAACPVRLARPGTSSKGSPTLLIAYDGSACADAVVAAVAARHWPKGTRATVLAVSEFQMRIGEIAAALTKTLEKGKGASPWPWMDGKLAKAAKRLASAGISVNTSLVIGEIRHSLLKNAKLLKADTIFLGSHGYTGLRRVMLGSVAAAIAAHAPCSVEVIHLKAKGKRK